MCDERIRTVDLPSIWVPRRRVRSVSQSTVDAVREHDCFVAEGVAEY